MSCLVLLAVLFHIGRSDFLLINSQTTPSDLICTNATSYDGCIINCFHGTNAYQRTIDCQDALICILNITTDSCAEGSTINASNTNQFEMYVTSNSGAESANIYLSMQSTDIAYIEAGDSNAPLLNANIYGNNAKNISLHCKAGVNKECSDITVNAENVKHLEIYIHAGSAVISGSIYCPVNGSCLIDVENNGQLRDSDIFAVDGINNLDSLSTDGLEIKCSDSDGNSCEYSRVRCGFNYTTYSVLKRYEYAISDWRWYYGDCSTLNKSNYDSDWYYVFGDGPTDQQLICPYNLLDLGYIGCVINCIYNKGGNRYLACGDGLCVINYENQCFVDSIDVKNASNTIINVFYLGIGGIGGTKFVGSTISDDYRINSVVMNCYSGCSVKMNFELIDYLEINVFDSIYSGNGQLTGSSHIYCPTMSNITPLCVINCNVGSECANANIYSIEGIARDLALNCDDGDTTICVDIDIQCGPFYNQTLIHPVYNSSESMWEYGLCSAPFTDAPTSITVAPTLTTNNPTKSPTPNQTVAVTHVHTTEVFSSTRMYTTSNTLIFTDFRYIFDNITPDVYVNMNKSLANKIEDIIDDLYCDNINIEYNKVDVQNTNNIMYDSNNKSVVITVRVIHEIIYEKRIINYTQSIQYKQQFIAETQKQYNDSSITVTIIYINVTNTPSPTQKDDEFMIDYTE
eukprot:220679_1